MIEYEETEKRLHSKTFHKNAGGWSCVRKLQKSNILRYFREYNDAINNDGFHSKYGYHTFELIPNGIVIYKHENLNTPRFK